MMWRTTIILSLFVLGACVEGGEESKLVKTAQGLVRGYKDPDHGTYAFLSIPYATAPTGPNKYKAPLPPPSWLEPLDATDKAIICPQAAMPMLHFGSHIRHENCLIANVYTPDTQEKNLPVVVYVHGGAFQAGWGTALEYKKLITEHNIIVVTFNYRLGIHGFLCLGTEDAPGNAGMKDQVALLLWVKKNIASFGGNPDDVTIAGYSAGSASVDLLMVAKSAEGLFNKVIPESGVSAAPFAIQPDPVGQAQWFAKVNNFTDVDDIYALEQFYKTATFETLTNDNFFERPDSTYGFSPCIERDSNVAFLVESPVDILTKGTYKKMPVLHGFANMEGSVRLLPGFFDLWKDRMDEKFSDFLPTDLKFESEEQKEEVAASIKRFYFGDKAVSKDILACLDYFSDVTFTYPTLREIKLMVENGHDEIYLYEYSFVDENTPVVPSTDYKGAGHCDQSNAVADAPLFLDPSKITDDFKKVSSNLRTLWGNFIKTGRPVPSGSNLPAWPAVGAEWGPHMSLDREMHLRGPLHERRAKFWEGIYEKHYRQPTAPPAPPAPPRPRKEEL